MSRNDTWDGIRAGPAPNAHRCGVLAALGAGVLLAAALPARAADPENCLSCHRYRGLARVDEHGSEIHLYQVDPRYYDYSLGPHARLRCTACHERSEVETIPHKPTSPVNCTNTCHLAASGEVEVRFSHEGIATALADSVHDPDILDTANELLGTPLREGQARCLLCHDEPRFRRSGLVGAGMEAPVERCAICHTDQLPKDTRYYYWHVAARARPARSHVDLVRTCAVCHSNERVRKEFELPDVTATYLASFHGKAMLLGSEQTAACLDCHAAELRNVHWMHSHEDPDSPTFETHLPDTCRSAACHPSAGARVSTAAVHLDLGTSGGIEYFIGVLFVMLILSTFGPSVVLQTLELAQVVCGRHDPQHHQRVARAEAMMRTPEGRRRLKRFTPHQRVQHWVLFASFTTLCVTGFPLKFADAGWAAWIIGHIGNLHRARMLHRVAGVVLLAGFAYHLTYIIVCAIAHKRRAHRSWVQTVLDLPMVMRWGDIKQLFYLLGYLLFLRRTRPEAGRFSLKEKFEYFGVFWGCGLLGVTGALMWANDFTSRYLTGRVLTVALLVHTFEAFLALLHVGVIHMIGVIFSPGVFPLSRAMFTGDTPAEELAEGHAAMLHDAPTTTPGAPAGEVSHG